MKNMNENNRNQFKLTSVCFAVVLAFGINCSYSFAASSINKNSFTNGAYMASDKIGSVSIYGTFAEDNKDFTIHTQNGSLTFDAIDGRLDRFILITNVTNSTANNPVPILTIDGNVAVDRFKSAAISLDINTGSNAIKKYAVIQVGTLLDEGYPKKAFGNLCIQGDISLNNISSASSSEKYKGHGVSVEDGSSLDLTKKDQDIGNISIQNSNFEGNLISLAGDSSQDTSVMGSTVKVGDINLENNTANHAVYMFGGSLDAHDIRVNQGDFKAGVLHLIGRAQPNSIRTIVNINDVYINNVTVKNGGPARILYIGTSNTGETQSSNKDNGSVNATIGKIEISDVDSTPMDNSSVVFINHNTDSIVSLKGISLNRVKVNKHVDSVGMSAVRFNDNKIVNLNNGEIKATNISMVRGEDNDVTTYWWDQFSVVFLQDSVNQLNKLTISSVSTDELKAGSSSISPTSKSAKVFLTGLNLDFSGTQKINNINIYDIQSKGEAATSGIYQRDSKNIIEGAEINVASVIGPQDTYGLHLEGGMKYDAVSIDTITSTNTTEKSAYGILVAKEFNIAKNATITNIKGYNAYGVKSTGKSTLGDIVITEVNASNDSTGIALSGSNSSVKALKISDVTAGNNSTPKLPSMA